MNALPHRDHNEAMAETYRQHPEFVAEMLNALMADGEEAEWRAFLPQLQLIFPEAAHAQMEVATVMTLFDLLRRLGLPFASEQGTAVKGPQSETIAA